MPRPHWRWCPPSISPELAGKRSDPPAVSGGSERFPAKFLESSIVVVDLLIGETPAKPIYSPSRRPELNGETENVKAGHVFSLTLIMVVAASFARCSAWVLQFRSSTKYSNS
ncbi:unnamed protein product [Cuscuta campestris]|uniref:Uncharacterized protein n=1 Tax=Cuscuta campestris TaxID=132261 RepID=A0A484LFA8_9ASTE|nr:unnamed protein product [Cuscuta campestris]